ncbi:MAG TPA: hypothetical protein VGN20_19395 [Mucilaginibacter sp.]|jgi:hypothetical protein
MLFEQNYIPILNYLKDKGHISISTISIPNIENNDLFDTLLELNDKEFVKVSIGQVIIEPKGEAYLRLYNKGELPKESPLINIGHIGNIITDSKISHSDLSIEALNHSIAPPNNTQPKQTIKNGSKSIFIFIRKNVWKFILGTAITLTAYFLSKKYL